MTKEQEIVQAAIEYIAWLMIDAECVIEEIPDPIASRALAIERTKSRLREAVRAVRDLTPEHLCEYLPAHLTPRQSEQTKAMLLDPERLAAGKAVGQFIATGFKAALNANWTLLGE